MTNEEKLQYKWIPDINESLPTSVNINDKKSKAWINFEDQFKLSKG